MREKPVQPTEPSVTPGITPACAGKTACSCNRLARSQDHPRMCGKNPQITSKYRRFTGSPPHVREKLFVKPFSDVDHRITPACAGKTTLLSSEQPYEQDHPRECGKNRSYLRLYTRTYRITPASAGKTFQSGNRLTDV